LEEQASSTEFMHARWVTGLARNQDDPLVGPPRGEGCDNGRNEYQNQTCTLPKF
jgi:hypothetical protein